MLEALLDDGVCCCCTRQLQVRLMKLQL